MKTLLYLAGAGLLILLFFANMGQESNQVIQNATRSPNTRVPRSGVYIYEVIDGPLNVRETPVHGNIVHRFDTGETFAVDFLETKALIAEYIWVKHERGWSAIQSKSNNEVFAIIVQRHSAMQGHAQQSEGGPRNIPNRRSLFKKLPVSLDDISWVQYFGNTWFAYNSGWRFNYNQYAQGLHAGLDLGSKEQDLKITAGLEGIVTGKTQDSIFIETDNYEVVYQHLDRITPRSAGSSVKVDDILGYTNPNHALNDHLHLEVRYKDGEETWIINPLLLMKSSDSRRIIQKFNSLKLNEFVYTLRWNEWIDPLDQPLIKMNGPVIGPKTLEK